MCCGGSYTFDRFIGYSVLVSQLSFACFVCSFARTYTHTHTGWLADLLWSFALFPHYAILDCLVFLAGLSRCACCQSLNHHKHFFNVFIRFLFIKMLLFFSFHFDISTLSKFYTIFYLLLFGVFFIIISFFHSFFFDFRIINLRIKLKSFFINIQFS